MPRTYYNKFNRGEIDEDVTARDDVERIYSSSSLMENWLPKRIGTMQYRAGTEYLGDVKENGSHYMIPFVDDGDNPTILELSQSTTIPSLETVRFWVNDALTTVTATSDTITNGSFTTDIVGWTADHTGTGSAVWESNGRLQLNGGSAGWGRVYQTITRTAGKRTLRVIVDESPILCQIGTSGTQSNDIFEDFLGFGVHVLTFEPDADYTITLANDAAYNAYVSECDHLGAGPLEVSGPIVQDNSGNAVTLTTLRYAQVADVVFVTDNGYELTGYSWPFWTLKRRGLESWSFELPNQQDGPFGLLNETSTTLTVAATTGNTTLTASVNFFDTATPSSSIRDQYKLESGANYGICEVVSVVSATVANVRILKEMPGTTAITDWRKGQFQVYGPGPTAVELFEGRLWLAGAGRVWASVSDELTSFDEEREGDSAAISKTLGFGPVQDVTWMRGGEVLLLGLSSEEIEINSNADYDVISPTNIRARRGTNKGAAKIRPEVVDKVIYMVQRGLLKLFALSGLTGEEIQAVDTTLLHPQVLSPGAKRLVYSSEPEPRMYILLTDGTLRVLLFDNVEEVNAWSRISLGGGGTFVDIVACPTQAEDAIYVIIERNGTRYLERFANSELARGQSDSRHYDSHVYFSAPGATATGLNHLEGETVYVWADGVEKTSAVVSGGSVTLPQSDYTDVVIGLRHVAKWKSNRLSRYVEATVINFRKRIVQMGMAARNVALRSIKYGPDESNLSTLPEVDKGRTRQPTTEPEPTIISQLSGNLTLASLNAVGSYVFGASQSAPGEIVTVQRQMAASDGTDAYLVSGINDLSNYTAEHVKVNGSAGSFSDLPDAVDEFTSAHQYNASNSLYYAFGLNGGGLDIASYSATTGLWDGTLTQPNISATAGIYLDAAMGTFGNDLVCFGVGGTGVNFYYKYSISGDSWTTPSPTGAPASYPKQAGFCAPQSGAGTGKMYVSCGITHGLTDLDQLLEIDLSTDAISTLSAPGYAKQDNELVSPGNGKLYDFGGSPRVGTTNEDPKFREYDIGTNTWTELRDGTETVNVDRPNPRKRFTMWATTTKIYIYGGYSNIRPDATAGVLFDLWEYDIATDTFTEILPWNGTGLGGAAGAFRVIDVSNPENAIDAVELRLSTVPPPLPGSGGTTTNDVPLSDPFIKAQVFDTGISASPRYCWWVDTLDNGNYSLQIDQTNDLFRDRPHVTPYDIGSFLSGGGEQGFILSPGTQSAQNFQVANNGLDIFAISESGTTDDIFRFRLNTPYDVNSGVTMTYINNGYTDATGGFAIDPVGGQKFLVLSRGGTAGESFGANHQLANPFDTTVPLTSITPTSYVLPTKSIPPMSRGFCVDATGKYAVVSYYFASDGYFEFDVYEMSTAWDANTASLVSTRQVSFTDIDPIGTASMQIGSIQLIADRNEFYIITSPGAALDQKLVKFIYGVETPETTPLQEPTVQEQTALISPTPNSSAPGGIWVSDTGDQMVIRDNISTTQSQMERWSLSTPYDFSTASLVATQLLPGSSSTNNIKYGGAYVGSGAYFVYSGQELSTEKLWVWTLTTPYELENQTSIQERTTGADIPCYFLLSEDGTKGIWLSRGSSGKAYGFTCSTPYDISVSSVPDYKASQFTPIRYLSIGTVSSNGKWIVLGSDTGEELDVYENVTAWDLSTCVYRYTTPNFATKFTNTGFGAIHLDPSLQKLYYANELSAHDVGVIAYSAAISDDNTLIGYSIQTVGDISYLITLEADDAVPNQGLATVNVSDPENPYQMGYLNGSTDTTTVAKGLLVEYPYAYVMSHSVSGSLSVIDVTDPTTMTEVETMALPYDTNATNSNKIASLGQYLYIAWEDDIHIVNKSDPRNLTVTTTTVTQFSGATQCIIDSTRLIVLDPVAGKMSLFDIGNFPTVPAHVGTVTDADLVGMEDLVSFYPWIYAVGGTKGLVVDFREALTPSVYATYTGFVGLESIAMADANIIYAGATTPTPTGKFYVADQRDWALRDYDEMSFTFDGTYDTDARFVVQSTGPCLMQALTIEVEDIDDPTNGSDRPDQS